MATFKYRAVNQTGEVINGRAEVASREELEQNLAQQGAELIDAKEQGAGFALFRKPITRDELAQFCFYTERLVAGGVPLLEGLSDVRDSVNNPTLRTVIGTVIKDVESGSSLSDALRRHPQYFDSVFVSLIAAGEESGELDAVLRNLGESIRWQDDVIRKTTKLLRYPLFAFIVIFGATGFLMYLVVPSMVKVLKSLGEESLPFYTEALIATSDFIVDRWYVILIVIGVVWGGVVFAMKAVPDADYYIDKASVRMPIFGSVLEKLLLSRFTSVFGLLYGAGVGVVDGLNIAKGALDNKFIARGLETVIDNIANGTAISESFRESALFPPLVLRMVRLGETTGGVDQAMLQIKSYYDRDTNEAIEVAQGVIPTVTMVLLAALLIWVVLAVYGPLYGALSNLA